DHRPCRDRDSGAGQDGRQGSWRAGQESLCDHLKPRRLLLAAAVNVFGTHRVAIDVGTVEAWHIDGRKDIVRQDPPEQLGECDLCRFERGEIERGVEAALGLVTVDDLEKLVLLVVCSWHRAETVEDLGARRTTPAADSRAGVVPPRSPSP